MALPKLTARQQEVLELIQTSITATGAPPTRAEIAQALGFKSANAAEEHLKALARKGAIELVSGTSRGIRLRLHAAQEQVTQLASTLVLPLIGRVAAGSPILAQEHIDTTHSVPESMFERRPDYLLRVRGMSMRDLGILDGDLLAVHTTREARNGQIVVARIDEEVTVKRFKREGNQVWLIAENPEFAPIEINLEEQELIIEGLSVGVIRR